MQFMIHVDGHRRGRRSRGREIAFKQATIDKITYEMAVLKRLKFAAKSDAFSAEQRRLPEEIIDSDLSALQAELDTVRPGKQNKGEQNKGEQKQPKRPALPPHLPRRAFHHELVNTTCSCGRVGGGRPGCLACDQSPE